MPTRPSNERMFVTISDGDGIVLARHEVPVSEIADAVSAVGLKHGEVRGARAVLDAVAEIASVITDDLIAAIARYRKGRPA